MSYLTFTKMHGLGNNYIYIDGFCQKLDENNLPHLAQQLSNVHTGIGSDGLILIGPSSIATAKMRIFNKDGSEGKNCGNGLRCVAKYLYDKGYSHVKKMNIETASGTVRATIVNETISETWVEVNMGPPRLKRSEIPMTGGDPHSHVIGEPFSINGISLSLSAVSMGNPHAIFFVTNFDENPHIQWGPAIENDKRFPEKINVEFVCPESSTSLRCFVWERGSGATQACGTGACASAVAAVLNGFCQKNKDITIHLEGGNLFVRWTNEGDILMTGPAVKVATGNYFLY